MVLIIDGKEQAVFSHTFYIAGLTNCRRNTALVSKKTRRVSVRGAHLFHLFFYYSEIQREGGIALYSTKGRKDCRVYLRVEL